MKLLWVLLAALLVIPAAYAVTHIDDQTLTARAVRRRVKRRLKQ
jgi:hypothetical protein